MFITDVIQMECASMKMLSDMRIDLTSASKESSYCRLMILMVDKIILVLKLSFAYVNT